MYVIQQPTKWEEYLHFVDFSYNNSYHESIKMSPFEVLYANSFLTPTNCSSVEDKLILEPDLLVEMEQVVRKV